MSMIERQVGVARSRLHLNLLFQRLALAVMLGGGAWTLTLLVDRALGLDLPLAATLWGALGVTVAAAGVGMAFGRSQPIQAAMAIDQAAGLKERISSAFAVRKSTDPFAQATVRDAEKVASNLHVPTHVPYRAPEMWPWSLATLVAAACAFALMPRLNLLAKDTGGEKTTEQKSVVRAEKRSVESQVNEQVSKVKKLVEDNPALKDLAKDLKPLDIPDKPDLKPEDIRREAIKKLDKLADQLADKRDDEKLRTAEELKKALADIKPQEGRDPSAKLMKELAAGDMKAAKDALNEIKKDLEEAAKKSGDPETQQKMQETSAKLENLAKQLEKMQGQDQKLQKELENKGGMTPEQAKKLLEEAAKMDPKALEKALQQALGDKGMKPQEIQEMAKKLAQNEEVKQAAKKLAEKMQKSADACKKQCNNPSQQGDKGQQGQQQGGQGQQQAAQEGQEALQAAGEQLSEMEMAEQMSNELDAQMSEVNKAREGMAGDGQCKNPGDKQGDKIGQQGPQYGQGMGASTGKQAGAHKYQAAKAPVKLQGGEIIGQKLIDGPQVKGHADAEEQQAIASALRDATDAIEHDQVPRMYENVVKNYFLTLAGLAGVDAKAAPAKDAKDSKTDESSPKPADKKTEAGSDKKN